MVKAVRIVPHIMVARNDDLDSSLLFDVSAGVAADIIDWRGDDRVGSDTHFFELSPPLFGNDKLGDWLAQGFSVSMRDAEARVAFFEALNVDAVFDEVVEVSFGQKIFYVKNEVEVRKLKLSAKSTYRSIPSLPKRF